MLCHSMPYSLGNNACYAITCHIPSGIVHDLYDDDDDDDYFYSIEDPLRGSTAGPPFLILDVAEFHFGRCSESSKLHGKTFENQCLEASECP